MDDNVLEAPSAAIMACKSSPETAENSLGDQVLLFPLLDEAIGEDRSGREIFTGISSVVPELDAFLFFFFFSSILWASLVTKRD